MIVDRIFTNCQLPFCIRHFEFHNSDCELEPMTLKIIEEDYRNFRRKLSLRWTFLRIDFVEKTFRRTNFSSNGIFRRRQLFKSTFRRTIFRRTTLRRTEISFKITYEYIYF